MSGPYEDMAVVEKKESDFTDGYKEALGQLRTHVRTHKTITDAQAMVFMLLIAELEREEAYDHPLYDVMGLQARDLIMDYSGRWYEVIEPWCMVRQAIKAKRTDGTTEYVKNNNVVRHISR